MKSTAATLLILSILSINELQADLRNAVIIKSIEVPIISNGQMVGSVELPAGSTLSIISVEKSGVMVSRGGGEAFKVSKDVFAPESLVMPTPLPNPSVAPLAAVPNTNSSALGSQLKKLTDSSSVAVSHETEIARVKTQMDDAISKVELIINQPVSPIQRTDDMLVWTYHPYWFDKGALKPDFNTIDVRKTQKLDYQHQYVTSDVNPSVVYIGYNLEFNPFTKVFYTDLSVPKKKLTETDMLEVNDLYRTIGKYEKQLAVFGVTNYLSEKITNQPVIIIH